MRGWVNDLYLDIPMGDEERPAADFAYYIGGAELHAHVCRVAIFDICLAITGNIDVRSLA